MFCYLSKKIQIPNNISLHALAWNHQDGWIACGGGSGLLKVLKLEMAKAGQRSSLTVNQSLDGYDNQGSQTVVQLCRWNHVFRKLVTTDQGGLTMVWIQHQGLWIEDMIYNRNQSVVKDFRWTPDGQKICIIHQDGQVIVGTYDGHRLWGKSVGRTLQLCTWSPRGQRLVFGTEAGQVVVHDKHGNFLRDLPLFDVDAANVPLAGMHWRANQDGSTNKLIPSLAIAFANGRIQLMRHDGDRDAVLIDSGLPCTGIEWNHDGKILAVAGTKEVGNTVVPVVQFYDPFGRHLRTLNFPTTGTGPMNLRAMAWEGNSLRIAFAVNNYIFFANVRPNHLRTYFANTLVYAYTKPDRAETCVMFWDWHVDQRYTKYVRRLLHITSASNVCVFAAESADVQNGVVFVLILCNSIGTPIDSKKLPFEPVCVTMTDTHVIAASDEYVYIWQFSSAHAGTRYILSVLSEASGKDRQLGGGLLNENASAVDREWIFHIDEVVKSNPVFRETDPSAVSSGELPAPKAVAKGTSDRVCAATAVDKTLVVARESGELLHFSLLGTVVLERRHTTRTRPQRIQLNIEAARLAIIDIHGVLTLFDIVKRVPQVLGRQSSLGDVNLADFVRKDVWDVIWSKDNPDLFATMEKGKMYVFRGVNAEEPVMSDAYLCDFDNLEIRTVKLDELMKDPEQPSVDHIVNFETKSLRDTRKLLETVPISEAFQFITDHPHKRLWKLLAEAALEQLNFLVAEKAFVQSRDYQGIQFVKRLKLLQDRKKQRAEVVTYFGRFDEAERIYINMDALDMALQLRARLGDWFRVVQIQEQTGAGDDKLLQTAYKKIGEYYADRQKWTKAFEYFEKAGDLESLAQCAYMLDDYVALGRVAQKTADGSPFLKKIGAMFRSVGLCREAVDTFLKAGDPKAAVDSCIVLNEWDQAVFLAEKHRMQQIEPLLTKYAAHLLQSNRLFQAVSLYRKARKHVEAARLLVQLAKQMGSARSPLRAKQLYVLAALEVVAYKNKILKGGQIEGKGGAASMLSLETLLKHDATTSAMKELEDPWHGVEAYHYLLMSQRLMYEGDFSSALLTALRLANYEDILEPKRIYSTIALLGYVNHFFGIASQAFCKLETLADVSEEEIEKFKKLALSIFTRHEPEDPKVTMLYPCPSPACNAKVREVDIACGTCSTKIPLCPLLGRPLLGASPAFVCRTCGHKFAEHPAKYRQNCPLCHTSVSKG